MTVTQTVPQSPQFSNIPKFARHGVITLFGYGIKVRVNRGHLFIEDGIGPDRRQVLLPRVGHGLRRLVVIGNDGMVSLAALRWLADQDAAFVMLERDGQVLATTGPVRSSDARLRRAQALANQSGVALRIARELISRKLTGQERVVRDKLLDSATAQMIAGFRADVDTAETMDAIRMLEAQGAAAYWSVWRCLPINFPKNDLRRVPDHWRAFDTRKSLLSGSQRLATPRAEGQSTSREPHTPRPERPRLQRAHAIWLSPQALVYPPGVWCSKIPSMRNTPSNTRQRVRQRFASGANDSTTENPVALWLRWRGRCPIIKRQFTSSSKHLLGVDLRGSGFAR